MQPFPHRYQVSAAADVSGDVLLTSDGVPVVRSASPREFGGSGGRWSPETLLVGAVADCFILTFRALARYARLPWLSLTCEAEGILDRVERVTQFTAFHVHAVLSLPPGANEEQAYRLLHSAEESCLITASLKAPVHLDARIQTGTPERAFEASPV